MDHVYISMNLPVCLFMNLLRDYEEPPEKCLLRVMGTHPAVVMAFILPLLVFAYSLVSLPYAFPVQSCVKGGRRCYSYTL